jgi:hypothetical protein
MQKVIALAGVEKAEERTTRSTGRNINTKETMHTRVEWIGRLGFELACSNDLGPQ